MAIIKQPKPKWQSQGGEIFFILTIFDCTAGGAKNHFFPMQRKDCFYHIADLKLRSQDKWNLFDVFSRFLWAGLCHSSLAPAGARLRSRQTWKSASLRVAMRQLGWIFRWWVWVIGQAGSHLHSSGTNRNNFRLCGLGANWFTQAENPLTAKFQTPWRPHSSS